MAFFFFFLLVAASKCGLAISKRRQQHVQHSEVATSHKYNSRCAPCHTVNDVAAHPSIHLMRCDAIGFTLNLLNSGDGSAQSTACRHQSNAANFLRQVVHHAAVSQTPRAPPYRCCHGFGQHSSRATNDRSRLAAVTSRRFFFF